MTGAGNPFVVYRHQLDVHRRAIAVGFSDEHFIDLVESLDARVAAVAGTGFVATPLLPLTMPIANRRFLAKVETANVGGSHKARHLFGLLLFAEIERASVGGADAAERTLGIASCGNAALAAAIIARAAERPLDVFVPLDADPRVLARLRDLGARVVSCERRPGELGDPCVARLAVAIESGARPFTVQGTTCPDAFDGARTLGLELSDQLDDLGVTEGEGHVDGGFDLYLQVGGGALTVATMDGLERAGRTRMRLHPVQAERAHPYVAAWERMVPRLLSAEGLVHPGRPDLLGSVLADPARRGHFDRLLATAEDIMVPWPAPQTSVASGILDDVTYDWRPLMIHQLRSGGWPVLATEQQLERATAVAAGQVVPPPDATGAAGLAGAMADRVVSIDSHSSNDAAVVVLSGVDRAYEAS